MPTSRARRARRRVVELKAEGSLSTAIPPPAGRRQTRPSRRPPLYHIDPRIDRLTCFDLAKKPHKRWGPPVFQGLPLIRERRRGAIFSTFQRCGTSVFAPEIARLIGTRHRSSKMSHRTFLPAGRVGSLKGNCISLCPRAVAMCDRSVPSNALLYGTVAAIASSFRADIGCRARDHDLATG